jgi:hypothetical protein
MFKAYIKMHPNGVQNACDSTAGEKPAKKHKKYNYHL